MRVHRYSDHADVVFPGNLITRVYGPESELVALERYVQGRVSDAARKYRLSEHEIRYGIADRPQDVSDRQARRIRSIVSTSPLPVEQSTSDALRAEAERLESVAREKALTPEQRRAERLRVRADAEDARESRERSDLEFRQGEGFRKRQMAAIEDCLTALYDPTVPRSEMERSLRRLSLLEQKQISKFDAERERDTAVTRDRLAAEGRRLQDQVNDWQTRAGNTLADRQSPTEVESDRIEREYRAEMDRIAREYEARAAALALQTAAQSPPDQSEQQ